MSRRAPSALLTGLVALLTLAVAGCGGGGGTAAPAPPPQTVTTTTEAAKPDFADLVAKVRSGVVRIEVSSCDGEGVGTGFLVGDRLVATVEHVVAGATEITLKRAGKSLGSATVIGEDRARDLALLRTDRAIDGYVFTFAERAPRVGEDVAALG